MIERLLHCIRLSLAPCVLFLSVLHVAEGQEGATVRKIMGGDLLRITVDESADLDGLYSVAGDGYIDFQYVGRIQVEELTMDEALERITGILQDKYFKKATVSIEVSEYVSGSLLVLGAVNSPGTIPYKGNEIITLLEALTMVGGLQDKAASDQVRIFRWRPGGSQIREVIKVNVKSMMENFDFSSDQFLRPRDIIVVPEKGEKEGASEFLALGEFGQPGFHQTTENMNMIRAISIAGGINRQAQLESCRILRPDGTGNYTAIPVDIARLLGSADMSMNLSVYPGDILFLPSSELSSAGQIYFLGEIEQPGMYPLTSAGESTLARTILKRGGLTKFSDGSAVRIQRKSPDGSMQTLTVDVDRILKRGLFDEDVPLQPEDVVIIPQRIFNIF
jgi:protein involved in polysaccharide export with SLBB domain